jgi:hypothetical protein
MPPPPPPFVCRCVKSLLYGGDNVTVPDPNPQKSANFRVKLGKVLASAMQYITGAASSIASHTFISFRSIFFDSSRVYCRRT